MECEIETYNVDEECENPASVELYRESTDEYADFCGLHATKMLTEQDGWETA